MPDIRKARKAKKAKTPGGKARPGGLSPEKRKQIAKTAAEARWTGVRQQWTDYEAGLVMRPAKSDSVGANRSSVSQSVVLDEKELAEIFHAFVIGKRMPSEKLFGALGSASGKSLDALRGQVEQLYRDKAGKLSPTSKRA